MERVVIDTGIFILGVAVGYLVGNQVVSKKEEVSTSTAETIEPVNTSTTETAPVKKKKSKKVVLTPSVA